MDVVLAVETVAGVGAPRLRYQPDRLVVANHLGRHAGSPRGFADVAQAFAAGLAHLLRRQISFHVASPDLIPIRNTAFPYFPPVLGRQRLSNSALLTTLTLLNAIAAPASTGDSKPSAASGIP